MLIGPRLHHISPPVSARRCVGNHSICNKNSFEKGSRSPNVPKLRNETSKLYIEKVSIFSANSLLFFLVYGGPRRMNRKHVTNRKCDLDTVTTEQQFGNFHVNYSTLYWSIHNTQWKMAINKHAQIVYKMAARIRRHVGVRRHLIVRPKNQGRINPIGRLTSGDTKWQPA